MVTKANTNINIAPIGVDLSGQNEMRRARIMQVVRTVARAITIILALLVVSIPFIYLFLNSVKPPNEFLTVPPTIIPTRLTWEHYAVTFNPERDTLSYLINSLVITTVTTVISVVIGALAAYSLSRLKLPFKLSAVIAFIFLIVRFYPKITTTLPYFILMRDLKLLDTQIAVIIAHVSLTLPLVVWLMLTFFDELPRELDNSAMLDGCGPLQRFVQVILPLTAPALLTAAILTALLSWNEFLISSSVTASNAKTLPTAVSGFITDKGVQWGPMSAMSTVIVVPMMMFALFAQRYLVRGLTLGAVKE